MTNSTRRSLLIAAATAHLATLAIPGATLAVQDDINQQRAHNVHVARKCVKRPHMGTFMHDRVG
jgi:hypothetical protein